MIDTQINLSVSFVESLIRLSKIDFPDNVIHQAKRCLLDYLGATMAGSQILGEKGLSLINQIVDSSGGTTVIGTRRKAGTEQAILLNGLFSHVAEMDDGVRFGMIHPGAPLFSALLAVAEKEKSSGEAIIRGIIIGYEASVRLAIAIQPDHYNAGYHPTATCGTIGAAIGIASMLCFDQKQMQDTFSAAIVSAFGSLKVIEDSSELKPLNVARAALNGHIAALIARSGFCGPRDVLSGKAGFLTLMTNSFNPDKLIKQEKEPYAIEIVYQKPYAACRHAHAAIDAALSIRGALDNKYDMIKDIKLETYESNIGKHDIKEIYGVSSAKMSIPFSIAVAIIYGGAGIDVFSKDCIKDLRVQELISKTQIVSSDNLTILVPEKRPAILSVSTINNMVFTERVDYPKGEPENPITDNELQEKFTALAIFGGYDREKTKIIIDIINDFETEYSNIFRYLQKS